MNTEEQSTLSIDRPCGELEILLVAHIQKKKETHRSDIIQYYSDIFPTVQTMCILYCVKKIKEFVSDGDVPVNIVADNGIVYEFTSGTMNYFAHTITEKIQQRLRWSAKLFDMRLNVSSRVGAYTRSNPDVQIHHILSINDTSINFDMDLFVRFLKSKFVGKSRLTEYELEHVCDVIIAHLKQFENAKAYADNLFLSKEGDPCTRA